MTDGERLLAAILADPDEDTPRLMLADEIDSALPNYAAFIRAQVRVAQTLADGTPFCPCDPWGRMPNGGDCPCGWCDPRCQQHRLWAYAICDIQDMPTGGMSWITTADWIFDPENADPNVGHAVVRRGFVDEVRLTAASFCGGPCATCDGRGRSESNCYGAYGPFPDGCPKCKATGRTPGLAADLFRAHPITRVDIGVKPIEVRGGPGKGEWIHNRRDVGEDLWWLLRNHPDCLSAPGDGPFARFRTESAARDALERGACVRYGRALAGLPDLSGWGR